MNKPYHGDAATPLLAGLVAGLAAVAAAFVMGGSNADIALHAARWTARAALPLFLIAFLASSLLRLWPGEATKMLVRRRRQWGLGFALAHGIHLVALGINVLVFGPSRAPETLVGGGLAYALIFLMALTSNDWSVKKLGKGWKRLHLFGIYYIWLIFTISYASRLGSPDTFATGALFTPILLGALVLRLYARFGRRRRVAG
jgi:methionine sulfoxide reductase heme-binding subunit